MIRRKVQRFEIVIVGFNHRTFGDRISEIAKNGDDFVLRADDRVLGADRAANAGERDVDRRSGFSAGSLRERCLDLLLNFGFELVNALSNFALGLFRGSLKPQFVDLGEDPVFARQPSVTEGFFIRIVFWRCRFLLQSGQQLFDGLVERSRREIFQFGDGVSHVSYAPAGLPSFATINPRLTPWAAFFRRFAAKSSTLQSSSRAPQKLRYAKLIKLRHLLFAQENSRFLDSAGAFASEWSCSARNDKV